MTQRITITGPERRRHGISTGLLYTWRKKAMSLGNRPALADPSPAFLPAVVTAAETALPLPVAVPASAPTIEVHLKGGVKVHIEAGMPEAMIAATLKALR